MWRRKWQPTPVFLPGESQGRRSLVGCRLWGLMHALEEEMATHSSILAWRISGMEEPGELPSMGSHRVGHNWSDLAAAAVLLWSRKVIWWCYHCESNTALTTSVLSWPWNVEVCVPRARLENTSWWASYRRESCTVGLMFLKEKQLESEAKGLMTSNIF